MKLKRHIRLKLFYLIVLLVILLSLVGIFKLVKIYRVKHAKVLVKIQNKEVDVFDKVKLDHFIESINGKLISNPKIDTTHIGTKEIYFEYINEDNIKVPYTFNIKVVDRIPPLITKYSDVTVEQGEKNFYKKLFCGDNYDNTPKCIVKGEYDINTPGTYDIDFIGIDSSNNESRQPIRLTVTEKKKKITNSNNTTTNKKYVFPSNTIELNTIIDQYKNKHNKIGIDISYWQGKIDYKKVKNSGVQFVIIRLGRQKGKNLEYTLDKKYKEYIEGFNKVKLPVGVYFYSYADSKEEARNQAKWVVKNIKKYDIDLPVVFDWENFDHYRAYNLSFYNLTEMAKEFMKEIEDSGYESMLYSSKAYLESVWMEGDYNVWLAHYTGKTDYDKKHNIWQITDRGKVPGINNSTVDIDIMYK